MRTVEAITADMSAALDRRELGRVRELVDEYRQHGTKEAERSALISLGTALYYEGQYLQAIEQYEHAVAVCEEINDLSGLASANGGLANVYHMLGRFSTAIGYYNTALGLHTERANAAGISRVLGNLGLLYRKIGDLPKALENFNRSMDTYRELGDKAEAARMLSNIAGVHSMTGDYPRAMELHHQALDVYQELQDLPGTKYVLMNIASVYGETDQYQKAAEYYQRASLLSQEMNDPISVATATGGIAMACASLGDYDAALDHMQKAIKVFNELGAEQYLASSQVSLVSVLLDIEDHVEALRILDSLHPTMISSPETRSHYHRYYAIIYRRTGQLNEAREHAVKALTIAEEHDLRGLTVDAHQVLRDVAKEMVDFNAYVHHNNEYLRIKEETAGREAMQRLTMLDAERKMDAERRERERERAVLYSTLPQHIADRVVRGEQVTGDHYDNAAVIFLDIVGFTRISEHLDPGDVVTLLSTVFTTLDGVCKQHGVTKIKTIGDSYMAVAFPDESSNSTQPVASVEERAASTALQMLDAISHTHLPFRSPARSPEGSPARLEVRIGLHSGPVTAGVIGTERLQYDVWGDTVNVASRMESSSEPGRIHVSETFAKALSRSKENNSSPFPVPRSPFPVPSSLTLRGEIDIKGKGKMTTYWLEKV